MPMFMDRHDVSDQVTAENVAHLHQEDLKIQDQFGCRGLTYWFDDKRKTAFCLIEARDKKDIVEMHNKAHGEVPNRVIEVEPGIVESFLGRIEDPEKAIDTAINIINDSAFRTIMLINVQGFFGRPGDKEQGQLLILNYDNIFQDIKGTYDGKQVKQDNNNILLSFSSVSNAVHAAYETQLLFKQGRNGLDKTNLKVALTAGVPVTDRKAIFEETIKSAERMCRVVKGEVIVSPEVRELYNSENVNSLNKLLNCYCLTAADEMFLNQLMDFTEANWSKTSLQVDDFIKPMGLSKSQLYRKLTQLTGESPNSFIREYRLGEASTLLSRNAKTIAEVAYETGFSSPSYFSKCFYKKYGYLPSDFYALKDPQKLVALT